MGDWFRVRKYLHFDYPLGDNNKTDIEKFLRDPKKVAAHSFYPFITYNATKYKIKEDPVSGKRYLDDNGVRPISYAAHMDAQIYSYYSHILSKVYESRLKDLCLEETVIAFRKLKDPQTGDAKSNIHLARDAFNKIKDVRSCKVYAFDITKFFDTLDADILKSQWCSLISEPKLPPDHFAIFNSVTKHSSVMKNDLYKKLKLSGVPNQKRPLRVCSPEDFRKLVRGEEKIVLPEGWVKRGLIVTKSRGIPQGSPISAILANIYMLDFDKRLNDQIKSINGYYYRYCDDIFCIIPPDIDFDCESFVVSLLKEYKLDINGNKTDRSVFSNTNGVLICNKPIQYLGFVFDGKNVVIRTSSISRYIRKAKKSVRLAKLTKLKHDKIRAAKGLPLKPLFKKKLFEKYYHVGKSNFIRYGYRAADVLSSPQIKMQMRKMCKFLRDEINKP